MDEVQGGRRGNNGETLIAAATESRRLIDETSLVRRLLVWLQ